MARVDQTPTISTGVVVVKKRLGPGANRNRAISLLRKASTQAQSKHGIGGRPKTRGVRTITLPKISTKAASDEVG